MCSIVVVVVSGLIPSRRELRWKVVNFKDLWRNCEFVSVVS